MITWLVIANATHALIYDISKSHINDTPKLSFHPLKELLHQESRLKTSELISDGVGRNHSMSSPASAYEPPMTAHEKESHNFAKELADYLDSERNQNHYKQLVVCAGPSFYHLLHQALTKQTALLVKKHIEKDYVSLPKTKLNDVIEMIHQESLKAESKLAEQ